MGDGLFRIGLGLGVGAMVGDFLVPALLAVKYPGYSHLRDTISTLGTIESPVKLQTSIWLVALGVGFLCFALGLAGKFQTCTWRHGLYLLAIVAFGLGAGIVAGLFPEDPAGAVETISGKVHGIGAGLGTILLLTAPIWAWGMPELATVKSWNAVGFAVAVISFGLFLASGKTGLGSPALTGLWQRLYLAGAYSTLLGNALALGKTSLGEG